MTNMYPQNRYIGITGTVGKTTTTLACYHVLRQKFRTVSTIQNSANLDSIFNIPITLLKVRPKTQKVVLEMGIEYPDEMDFYLSLVHPGIGIVTRVSYQHSEFLGDVEKIFEEKSKLIKQLPTNGTAILNWDDTYTRKMADLTKANVIFFGSDPKNCHVWATNVRIHDYQTKFELNYGVERVEVAMQIIGRHYVTSALAAAALGLSNGMSLMAIKKGLEEIKGSAHRMQLVEGLNGSLVLDDTYNNAPVALEAAVEVLSELPARRRILVLGEMKELGQFSQKMHRQVARKIYANKVDLVLMGPGDTRYVADELKSLGFPEDRMEADLTHPQLVARILKAAGKGDVVLVKGARSLRLDEIVKRIIKQR